ncbi:MAG: von Willebrand factor type A domain-containing protein [Lewinellaceae bacterium]|nr:von Willebrand factor type A domain-containing protein [Lewinellaceae bacterium]
MKNQLVLAFLSMLLLAACETSKDRFSSQNASFLANSDTDLSLDPGSGDNPFILADTQSVSTFSVDADGASYANIKRHILDENNKPESGLIRIEELINYFPMNYVDPNGSHPIALNGEVSDCPWSTGHKLVRIGIKGKTTPVDQLPQANWVLLVDVSGSMSSSDKLPLFKKGLTDFVQNTMRTNDRLAIVTYAGQAGLLLPSTSGTEKTTIKNAINSLGAGGSTAGAQGIITAYEIAAQHFIQGGNNRIILCTDGDFNVGPSSQDDLVALIEEKRQTGIFLTVVGCGLYNYNDGTMEQVADNGNGTVEYIADEEQARKVFVEEFGKFYTVAKDVKVQVKFNAQMVESYRLIGYENRVLNNEDFENDAKDAGEIGSGQTVTALYELIPKTGSTWQGQNPCSIDFRYKEPDSDMSQLLDLPITDFSASFNNSTENMRWSASIASFGMLLRNSAYKGSSNYSDVINWAENAKQFNPGNYRDGFIQVVKKAKTL